MAFWELRLGHPFICPERSDLERIDLAETQVRSAVAIGRMFVRSFE